MKFEYTLMETYSACPLAKNDFMESSPFIMAAPPHHHAGLAVPLQEPPHGKELQFAAVCEKCFLGLPPPHLYKLSLSLVNPCEEASDANWFMFPPEQPSAVYFPLGLQLMIC
jgi:hypothetical protein